MTLKDLAAVFALAIAATAVSARAGYIMDVVEVGSDSVTTGSGRVDLTLWSLDRFLTVQSAGDAGGLLAVGGESVAVNVGNARPRLLGARSNRFGKVVFRVFPLEDWNLQTTGRNSYLIQCPPTGLLGENPPRPVR